jgi:hypothetical protein
MRHIRHGAEPLKQLVITAMDPAVAERQNREDTPDSGRDPCASQAACHHPRESAGLAHARQLISRAQKLNLKLTTKVRSRGNSHGR